MNINRFRGGFNVALHGLVGRVRVSYWAWRMRRGWYYRRSTTGPKWHSGEHYTWCVLYAPDNVCICKHVAANAPAEGRASRTLGREVGGEVNP